MKKSIYLVGFFAAAMALQGCMVGYHGMYEKCDSAATAERQMTTKDVITMSQEGISDSLIVAQIHATHSVFALSTQDILDLQKAGVSDHVIQTMIDSPNSHNRSNMVINRILLESDPWPYWGAYYGPYYYPPAFYVGVGRIGFGGHFGHFRR